MKKIYIFLALALMWSVSVKGGETPLTTVELLNTGIKGEPGVLLAALRASLDLNRIAIRSIGKRRWQIWDKAQRRAYVEAFAAYVLTIYLYRFRDYEGSGLDIYDVQRKKNSALVYARIKPQVDQKTLSTGKPININFLLYNVRREGRDHWLINDVYFKGTISEVASFRVQFTKILQEEGHAGLIREMNKKCQELKDYCPE